MPKKHVRRPHGQGGATSAVSRKNLNPKTPQKGFGEYLATPTMARRRAKAERQVKEANQLPDEAMGRFAWLLDPDRRRRVHMQPKVNPLEQITDRVTRNATRKVKTSTIHVRIDNEIILELIDLCNVSGLTLSQLVGGFVAQGIEGLYHQLDAAQTTLAELRKTHDDAASLARFAYRPRRGNTPAAPRQSTGDAPRPKAASHFPSSKTDGR